MSLEKIYVELLNEGVQAWRPVDAERLGNDAFRIVQPAVAGEQWAFPTGTVVRCYRREFAGGDSQLVAGSEGDLA